MRKPNFFIVGAPKCGTTALSEYLKGHPQICFSLPKEPHYFSDDLHIRQWSSERAYLRCFRNITAHHRAIGEASILYLYSSSAVSNIVKFNREAKFIVMVRNPVELVYSWHMEVVYNGHEDVEDFRTAWNLSEDRRRGRNVPKHCREPKLLYYGEIGKLGQQLERLYGLVPAEQVKVIIFDDFVKDTARVYEACLQYLNVPSDARSGFLVTNRSRVPRSRVLARMIHYIASEPTLVRYANHAKRAIGINSLGVLAKLGQLNARPQDRAPMPKDLRAELCEYFRDDVATLSGIVERDLSHWLGP